MSKCLEHMTVDEVGEWLQSHGFRDEVVAAFEGTHSLFIYFCSRCATNVEV